MWEVTLEPQQSANPVSYSWEAVLVLKGWVGFCSDLRNENLEFQSFLDFLSCVYFICFRLISLLPVISFVSYSVSSSPTKTHGFFNLPASYNGSFWIPTLHLESHWYSILTQGIQLTTLDRTFKRWLGPDRLFTWISFNPTKPDTM